MPFSLKPLLFSLLVCSVLPRAVLAIEPNVTTDVRSKAQRTNPDVTCVQIPDSYQTTGPFTVKELEAEVEFGKALADWRQFLRQLQKGDQLLMYDEGCCKGIIIVRKGCIVDWFQMAES
jgi:hypothetical protein